MAEVLVVWLVALSVAVVILGIYAVSAFVNVGEYWDGTKAHDRIDKLGRDLGRWIGSTQNQIGPLQTSVGDLLKIYRGIANNGVVSTQGKHAARLDKLERELGIKAKSDVTVGGWHVFGQFAEAPEPETPRTVADRLAALESKKKGKR